eukprot:GHVT01073943.1.p1 GENE.GHVT01073943.1~~GHVT01073943.1.p1  ORF type:complete len:250 (-),score=44.14 GHVT01073943.1:141-890(-)
MSWVTFTQRSAPQEPPTPSGREPCGAAASRLGAQAPRPVTRLRAVTAVAAVGTLGCLLVASQWPNSTPLKRLASRQQPSHAPQAFLGKGALGRSPPHAPFPHTPHVISPLTPQLLSPPTAALAVPSPPGDAAAAAEEGRAAVARLSKTLKECQRQFPSRRLVGGGPVPGWKRCIAAVLLVSTVVSFAALLVLVAQGVLSKDCARNILNLVCRPISYPATRHDSSTPTTSPDSSTPRTSREASTPTTSRD